MNRPNPERLTILQLALMTAYKKLDECQHDINELEQKQSIMKADGACLDEMEDVKNSITYIKHRLDGWQNIIDATLEWEIEITQ